MTSTNRWTSDTEIEHSKDATRRNSQTTIRHHYVPKMYLKRWSIAGSSEIQYLNVKTNVGGCVDPDAIAFEENFYEIEASDIDSDLNPNMWFETHMGRIEDKAAHWLRALDGLQDGRVRDPNILSNLAVYVGLQSQRTIRSRQSELDIGRAIEHYGAKYVLNIPDVLPSVCTLYNIPYSLGRHREIAQSVINQGVISTSAQPKAIESAIGVWRNQIVPHLENDRSWWLASTKTPLITSDEPVVLIGTKRHSRELPVSFRSAPLILFPIGPRRLLVLAGQKAQLRAPTSLTPAETKFVNRELAFNCNELIFDEPGSTAAVQIRVPPYPSAAQEFPASVRNFAELARLVSLPTRWTGAPYQPQWPLSRWTTP